MAFKRGDAAGRGLDWLNGRLPFHKSPCHNKLCNLRPFRARRGQAGCALPTPAVGGPRQPLQEERSGPAHFGPV